METDMSPFSNFASNFYRKKWKYYNKLIVFNNYYACEMFLKCFVYNLSSYKRVIVIELRNENEQKVINYSQSNYV